MLNWKLAFNIPDSQVRVQHTYLRNSKAERARTQPENSASLCAFPAHPYLEGVPFAANTFPVLIFQSLS